MGNWKFYGFSSLSRVMWLCDFEMEKSVGAGRDGNASLDRWDVDIG
jgi:hypothetical protein